MFDSIPHRNRIRCNECDGHGVYSIANSLDPYAKLYDCEACEGSGDARCSECDEAAVDIYSHTSRGQTFSHPVCAAHLAEWQEDEAERVEELDPDRLREDRDERAMLRKEWAE